MRSECVFCGTALTPETRAIVRTSFTRSGVVASNKSWCQACDAPDAAVRAKRALEAERRTRTREYHRAYMRAYNQRPEVQQQKRAADRTRRFRQRASFRCADCTRRFAGNREAKRKIDGRVVKLGLCAFCAEQRYGPPVTAPVGGWAAYLRDYRARQKASAGKALAA